MFHYIVSLSRVGPEQFDDVCLTLLSSSPQSLQTDLLATDLFKAEDAHRPTRLMQTMSLTNDKGG